MKEKRNLVQGDVVASLLQFTLPILLSLLLQIAYGSADLFIVSRFSDNANMSGVSIGSQISLVFTNLMVGLSIGTTILIGQFLGAKEDAQAAKVLGTSVVLFSFLAVVSTFVMLLSAQWLLTQMKTPLEAFALAKSYLSISALGSIFIVWYNLLGSIFRGIGDSSTPLKAVFIACICNIVLDLYLVAILGMGAVGAAIATVVAQGISVVVSLVLIRKKGLPFPFSRQFVKVFPVFITRIFSLGIPSAVQMLLTNFSFLVIASFVNQMGVSASAAVGVVGKIVGFIMVVPMAFTQSLAAFTAQNYGANRMDRSKKALLSAIGISVAYGACTGLFSYFRGDLFALLFDLEPETAFATTEYLKAYAIDCVLVAVSFSLAGFFNGCGHTKFVMFQGVLGACVVRIPVSYYFSTMTPPSLFLLGLAIPISTAVQIPISLLYLWVIRKSLQEHSPKSLG